MRGLVDRAGSPVVATVVGWTFLAVAASLAFAAVLGALAGPSVPVPVWRQMLIVAALGLAIVTGLGLSQGWRGAGTVLDGVEPAREVAHWSDGSWTVGDGINDPNLPEAAIATHIAHALARNSSRASLASMPPGSIAQRSALVISGG